MGTRVEHTPEFRPFPQVPVIGIRKRQLLDERLVFRDQTIRHGVVHQLSRASQPRGRDVRSIFQQVADPLVVDLIGPARLESIRQCDAQQQVAQLCGIEDARIKERDEVRHAQ